MTFFPHLIKLLNQKEICVEIIPHKEVGWRGNNISTLSEKTHNLVKNGFLPITV